MHVYGHVHVIQLANRTNYYYSYYHQLLFPSFMCFATSSGNDNPFMSKSVIDLQPSIQASNGEQQMYHPAQKNPTGHAIKISTRNQIIAQRTFIFSILEKRRLC